MHAVSVDLTQDNDAGLVAFIGAASSSPADRALADSALRLLFDRHFGFIKGVLKSFSKTQGAIVIDADEMAIATFLKAFRSADTFRDTSGGCPEAARILVRAWLCTIAKHLAQDELRKHARGPSRVLLDEDFDVAESTSRGTAMSPTAQRRLNGLQGEIDKLSETDRDVVVTYANLGIRTATGGLELHIDDRLALELRTGLERDTLRQRKSRIFRRLRLILEEPPTH